jgi:NADH-quinone oxidoreductase subunit K
VSSEVVIAVSVALFIVGAMGVVVRRNAIALALSTQLLFAASLLVLAAHDRRVVATPAEPSVDGTVFAWIVLVAMAAELVLALVLATSLARHHGALDVERSSRMRE